MKWHDGYDFFDDCILPTYGFHLENATYMPKFHLENATYSLKFHLENATIKKRFHLENATRHGMGFKRKIYNQIKEWKEEENRNSALLIEGARRVGKTTIVKEFAKNEYDNYIYIDFTYTSDEVKNLFKRINPSNVLAMDQFFSDLFLIFGKVLNKGDLIIFDEVQHFPLARQAIKALVYDGRFDYIETGSLISIRANTMNIQIPSEERRIEMHPMDFEEFCWAFDGAGKCDLLRTILNEHKTINDAVHNQLMDDFRLYLALGGMPKVVSLYQETKSFMRCEKEKQDILKLYEDDLRKHDNNCRTHTLNIYDSMLPALKTWSKRVKMKMRNHNMIELYQRSLKDLEDSKIVNSIYRCSDLSFGSLTREENIFKLYPLDVGLMLSSLIGDVNDDCEKTYFKIRTGKLDGANYGTLYESLVAQSLACNGRKAFYHVFEYEDKRYEIDFVAFINGKMNAIEVKSTKRFTTSSLSMLKSKYPQLKFNKIVISPKNLSYDNDVTYLPIYMLFLI